ncbi:hypothetical protein AX15_003033, partial [Amanita polypyramis BW_CC]
MLPQCFGCKKINGINRFKYMGRSQFLQLQERIKDKNFEMGAESIYLQGNHISLLRLCIISFVKDNAVREGQPVSYIPDCSSLLLDLAVKITTESVDTLIRSMKKDPDVYIIIDQVNVLGVGGDGGRGEKEVRVLNWLDNLRSDQQYIFSASVNENSNRGAYKKQNGIS